MSKWTAPPRPATYDETIHCDLCSGTRIIFVDGNKVSCTGCRGTGDRSRREAVSAELRRAARDGYGGIEGSDDRSVDR